MPRLKFMNVSRIAPNRVCCNALLAAYARAKPAQWEKVRALEICALSHQVNKRGAHAVHGLPRQRIMTGLGFTEAPCLRVGMHAGTCYSVEQTLQMQALKLLKFMPCMAYS